MSPKVATFFGLAVILCSACYTPSRAERAQFIETQRKCDALWRACATGTKGCSDSETRLRWNTACAGCAKLPDECEAPGTEDRPDCSAWAQTNIERAGHQSSNVSAPTPYLDPEM